MPRRVYVGEGCVGKISGKPRGRNICNTKRAILRDLFRIARLWAKQGRLGKGSGRHELLWVAARVLRDGANALQELDRLNRTFNEEYAQEHLSRMIRDVAKSNEPKFKPHLVKVRTTGDTVLLGVNGRTNLPVSQEEMRKLKLDYFITDPYKKERAQRIYELGKERKKKLRRNPQGMTRRQAEAERRSEAVCAYLKASMGNPSLPIPSVRELARRTGASKSTIARILRRQTSGNRRPKGTDKTKGAGEHNKNISWDKSEMRNPAKTFHGTNARLILSARDRPQNAV